MLKTPFSNIKVIDFGCYLAGPLTGMLLADQGFEVIKIDPLEGPIFDHPVNSILGRNKSHLRVNLKDQSSLKSVKELIKSADILIENFSSGVMQRLGLSLDDVLSLNPRLIYVSLPGFSDDNKLTEGGKAFEGIIAASMGHYTDIHAIRTTFGLDPVFTALPLSSVYAAVHAATAAVLALREVKAGKRIEQVIAPLDAGSLSAMTSMFLKAVDESERFKTPRLPTAIKRVALPILKTWAKSGLNAQQKILNIARKAYPALMDSYACKDGRLLYIFAIDNLKLVVKTLRVLNLYDDLIKEGILVRDPYTSGDLSNNLAESSNLSKSWQSRIKQKIAAVLAEEPAVYWENKLKEHGVTCTIQRTTQEWLALEELKASSIIVEVADENGNLSAQPGLQTWLSESPKELMQPSPARSISIEDVVNSTIAVSSSTQLAAAPSRWLEGVTVIDMTSMVAGPVSARALAEYGANVIKIETPTPNHGPRMTCWYGMDVNQGKQSILLDMKTAEGQAVFEEIIKKVDILVTNQPESVMATFNLTEERIRKDYPKVIYSRLGAYNGPKEGPWSKYSGYDPVLQAAAGIMLRYGSPSSPELHAVASCVDALTGYSAMFGTALALYRKEVTDKGCTVNTSLSAAATLVQLPYSTSASAHLDEPSGQLSKGENMLYRLYRTQDCWIFVAGKPNQLEKVLTFFEVRMPSNKQKLEQFEKRIRSLSSLACIRMFKSCGVTATPVENIDALRTKFLANDTGQGLFIKKYSIPGLGPIYISPAQQIFTSQGGLKELGVSEKIGSSGDQILRSHGFDSERLFKLGVVAKELSHEYLPS